MKSITSIGRQVWDKILISVGVLLVLVPTSPLNMPLVFRDSGVFLYAGWRILHGQIPYRDIWDHKPPVILYINALGLAMGVSRWGVWFIELVSLFSAAYFGFALVRKLWGTLPAIFSLYLWLLSLVFTLEGGNLTTEYTLPIQFFCLWMAGNVKEYNYCSWRGYLTGFLCGIAFLTKQNTVGIGASIILYLIVNRLKSHQPKKLFQELGIVCLGGLTPLIIAIVFFSTQGALLQFWDAAFRYNFAYSSATSLPTRIKRFFVGLELLSKTGLAQLGLIGYAAGLVWLFLKRHLKFVSQDWLPLLSIALIDLPIELIMVNVSGRTYAHYYMGLLPILSVLTGFTFWLILRQLSLPDIPRITATVFTMWVLGVFSLFLAPAYLREVNSLRKVRDDTVIEYIKRSTSPDDMVLLWGAEPEMNFFAQRRSPSRFVYQYPLYQSGYTNEKIITEFLKDLIHHKPCLIIDTKDNSTPLYNFPVSSDEIQAGIVYLQSHYPIKEHINSWTVYEYVDSKDDDGTP